MGGALSYGTARPAMASLIQMLQDSETAPTTTDYSLVNEKTGDGMLFLVAAKGATGSHCRM